MIKNNFGIYIMWTKKQKIVFGIIFSVLFLGLVVYVYYSLFNFLKNRVAENENCNVQGINIHGALISYVPMTNSIYDEESQEPMVDDVVASETIVGYIRIASADPAIKALVIEVDSPGGNIITGQEISNALKEVHKPVVGLIRGVGASAAYHAISSADYIFASKYSDVGSIGVTMSYLEKIDESKKYINLSAGKFKDSGSPEKSISEEEKAIFMRDVNISYENLIQDIAANRNLHVERIRSIADGSTVMGERAVELGLVDALGSWTEVENYLTPLIGDDAWVCWQ